MKKMNDTAEKRVWKRKQKNIFMALSLFSYKVCCGTAKVFLRTLSNPET